MAYEEALRIDEAIKSMDKQIASLLYGVAAENKISGTSVFKSRQTYEGVSDTCRVLFLMTLLLISPKISENSFRVYYKRLVDR